MSSKNIVGYWETKTNLIPSFPTPLYSLPCQAAKEDEEWGVAVSP